MSNLKSLDLEKLREIAGKTTLGFKCPAKVKLKLAENAQLLGVTLSEYVENIVLNYDPTTNERLKLLTERVEFYENPILKKLFEKNKNQEVEFTTESGNKMKIKIRTLFDTYTAVINSFKSN